MEKTLFVWILNNHWHFTPENPRQNRPWITTLNMSTGEVFRGTEKFFDYDRFLAGLRHAADLFQEWRADGFPMPADTMSTTGWCGAEASFVAWAWNKRACPFDQW